jgi:hypothetical protein
MNAKKSAIFSLTIFIILISICSILAATYFSVPNTPAVNKSDNQPTSSTTLSSTIPAPTLRVTNTLTPPDFIYKNTECRGGSERTLKVRSEDDLGNVTYSSDGPVEFYYCQGQRDSIDGMYVSKLLKFPSGKKVEVKDKDDSTWDSTTYAYSDITKYNDQFYVLNTFTGGPHCCMKAFVIDVKSESITDSVVVGSLYSSVTKVEGHPVIAGDELNFENYAGADRRDSRHPAVFYAINSKGIVELFNPKLSLNYLNAFEKSHDEEIKKLDPEDRVINYDNVCMKLVVSSDGSSFCNNTSDEGRMIAAVVATYLFANREDLAKSYFYKIAKKTDSNEKFFQDIKNIVDNQKDRINK